MHHLVTPPTEEQMHRIIDLTRATREEILKTIKISRVNVVDIIGCLEKIKHYDNLTHRSQQQKQGH